MSNKNQDYWHQLVEALAQGVVIINKEGEILYTNEYAAKLFSTSSAELLGTNFLYPLSSDESQEIEILQPNNGILTAQMTVKEGAWRNCFAWIISLQNISDLKSKEKQLSISSQCISSAFEGIVITDPEGTIREVNRAFLKMTGYKESELIGVNCSLFHSDYQDEKFYQNLWQILLEEEHWSGELWGKGKKNKKIPIYLSISTIKNLDGDITNYVGIFYDLTLIKKQEKQIAHIKYYDLLTGLPNQFLLTQKIERCMAKSLKERKNLIILSIRIFNPDIKNLRYGENSHIQDQIILQTVDRIERASRGMWFLARLGYREFVVVYLSQRKIGTMGSVAQRIIENIVTPYQIDNKNYHIQCVIGLNVFEKNSASSAEELLHQAEIARHKARQMGINVFEFFDPKNEIELLEFNKHIESIRDAIKLDQLQLYYQPKVNLQSGRVVGLEALLRWLHPEQGLLVPAQFLANLNDHPIAIELAKWVLNSALQQAERLLAYNFRIPISLNISSYQFQDKNFVKNLEFTLAKYPTVSNTLIMFEILETEALEDLALVSKIIKDCRNKGILFALDDFGTGYSSLTYLKELDAAEVKLDQSFVRDMLSKPKDLAILKAVIELCHTIGRDLIAEGVETITDGKLLWHLGCPKIQGYVISKPLPATELIPWLRAWKLDQRWRKNSFSSREINDLINAAVKHYIQMESIQNSIDRDPNVLLNLNFAACPVEKWLIKHKQQFEDKEIFDKVFILHQKQHAMAREIIELVKLDQLKKAYEQSRELEMLRGVLLKDMVTAVFH